MAMSHISYPPDNVWLVQKYGGTSLGRQLPSIVNEILLTYVGHNKLAIVCSAISGEKKSNGTTSLLLEAIDVLINKATSDDDKQCEVDRIVSAIWSEHVTVLESLRSKEYERGNDALIEAKRVIKAECDSLSVFLLNAVVCR
jgi:aspartate kinase